MGVRDRDGTRLRLAPRLLEQVHRQTTPPGDPMTHGTLLTMAAIAGLAALPSRAAEATTSTTERVAVRRVAVGAQAAPEHSVAVFSRAVDGGAPSMSVQLLGEGGEAEVFDLAEIEVGESRRFTSDSGREVEIARTEDGVTLTVDGKSIALPGLAGADGEGAAWAAASGPAENVVVMAGEPHVLVARLPAAIDVESLESVKRLRPGIRDEVVAALKEI